MGWHLCERLDDLHLAATLGTGRLTLVVVGGRRGVFWFGGHRSGVWGRGRDLLRRKQLVDAGEFGFPMAVGKEAVMADALEAVGQNVEQKAADELGRCKRHELDERTVAVVLPTEGNVIIGDLDEAMIGDGDAVCIAAQIARPSAAIASVSTSSVSPTTQAPPSFGRRRRAISGDPAKRRSHDQRAGMLPTIWRRP